MSLIISSLLSMNTETLALGLFMILYCIALAVTHGLIFKSKDGNTKKVLVSVWYAACSVPIIVCGIHFAGHYLKGLLLYSLKLYMPMYAGAVLIALFPIFAKRKRFIIAKITASVLTAVGVCVSLIFLLVTDWVFIIGNGTRMSYVKSFELLTSEMEKHYVMNEWKGIDYDKIKAELLPEIEEAEKNNDLEAYYIALQKYINNFHDGHVWIETNTLEGAQAARAAKSRIAGNDYGFSLFTVSTGETIAVLVEDGCEAMNSGITNGTVITKWNGVPIDKAISEAEYVLVDRDPVLANTEMKMPIYFAGMGGDSVEVSFKDNSGAEKTVSIKSIGNYKNRLNYAEECLLNGIHLPSEEEIAAMSKEELVALISEIETANENFSCRMITEDCGYLLINSEMLDTFKDTFALIKGSYPEVTEMVDKKLEEMKAQGMKKLVIDTRGNGGGITIIINAVVTLFTDKEIFMGTDMYIPYWGGEAKEYSTSVIPANGKWSDLPVVVLTNLGCASSGDGLVYALSQCPNVTTTGISDTEGIYQSIGAICYLSGGDFSVRYPMYPTVGEDGNPFIDPSADRKSQFAVDEKIPITREAALEIFSFEDNVKDYELEYAIGLFDR
ncbi:MAG: S41 family peptidase [Oscillospiraceae bacterium]